VRELLQRVSTLPLADDHERALETCSFCPNLCRSYCPVAQAERTEVAVPTFKMQLARLTLRGEQALDEDAAAVFYKCTGCHRSRSGCRHDIAVDAPLRAGRERAVAAGVEPPSVTALAEKFERCGSPFSVDLDKALSAALGSDVWHPGTAKHQPKLAFAPACTTVAREPDDLRDSHRVLKAALGDNFATPSAGCCGAPLYSMGLRLGFKRAAWSFREKLKGFDKIVTTSPQCAWTMRVAYPEAGLPSLNAVPIESILIERIDQLKPQLSTLEPHQALYHDACSMGRRLGLYIEPRRLLALATGRWPAEFNEHHALSPCAGAGGGYAWTHPEGSAEIARRCLKMAPPSRQQKVLVSACPDARRKLAAADRQQVVSSVARLLANALQSPQEQG